MSSIPYSGGTIIDTTFVGDTRAAIATAVIAQLLAAGWTSIAGAGTDQVLESATTPEGSNTICMRVYDPLANNCARILMRDAAGVRISQDVYLLPAGAKTFRIIACKFNFFVFVPGASVAREFACGGTLAVPGFLSGVLTSELGFLQGNATGDAAVVLGSSFRTRLSAVEEQSRHSGLVNATLMNVNNNNDNIGNQRLIFRGGSRANNNGNTCAYRWADDTVRVIEAEIAWGISGWGDEAKSYGFLHNCMIASASYAADDRTITSYDAHAWHAITSANAGLSGIEAPGTLFVAIG